MPSQEAVSSSETRKAHARFKGRVKRLLCHAAKEPGRYDTFKAALAAELSILQGTSPWLAKLKVLLQRAVGTL